MPSGVVLAGGRSSRMGLPKALLHVGGIPMIERVVETLRSVCDEVVVVANDPGLTKGLDVRVVADAVADEGPLRGFEAGLAAATEDPCVVVACDMPFVDAGVLAYLLRLAEDADAVVPRWESGREEPLHAVYRRSCLAAIKEALHQGERRAAGFLPSVHVAFVEEAEWRRLDPEGRSWWNVNTPADLERANSTRD